MTEDEITAILDKAHGCVDSECAVDDVSDLIAELKDQQKVLNDRLETIMNVVSHLQAANESEKRKTDDVRAIIKDMMRVFTDNKVSDCLPVSFVRPRLSPITVPRLIFIVLPTFAQDGKFAMSFSGDIGDGPTTAYDALPPKPWKAAP